ncbi:MAG: 50S ribosomal protein L15 [Oligoflexia bacterium]|nr:50S ribosomal protein L15 [Oligoflexia bacterium]
MKLSNLSPAPGSRKRKVRVGRGESSGCGKTSGRGGKGQTARTGGGVRPGFEGGQMPLYRRLPKFGFVSMQRVYGTNQYNLVNLTVLEKFDNGATVDWEQLQKIGYAKDATKKAGLKILGNGALTKKLTVKTHAISKAAQAAIEKAGGTVELLPRFPERK